MAKFSVEKRTKLLLALVIVVSLFLGVFAYPNLYNKGIDAINSKFNWTLPHFWNVPFHLGLDLQGGTQLLYEADTSKLLDKEKADAIDGARDVIERRVNALGVAEPIIQTVKAGNNYRVSVELAGIKNVQEAIDKIGETPLLEFKEINNEPPRTLTGEEQEKLKTMNKDEKALADQILKEAKTAGNFDDVINKYKDNEKIINLFQPKVETSSIQGLEISTKADYTETKYLDETSGQNELYEAAKAMAKGPTASRIVETSAGYSIIQLMDTKTVEQQINASHILICWQGAEKCSSTVSKEEAKNKIDSVKKEVTTANFEELAKKYSNEPGATDSGGNLGWFGKDKMVKSFGDAAFALQKNTISEVVETEFGYHLIFKKDQRDLIGYGVKILTVKKTSETDLVPPPDPWKNTGLSGQHLKSAVLEFDQRTNNPYVSIEFNDEGKDLFAKLTERLAGQKLAIFLDGEAISVPTVQEAIREGKAMITGDFTVAEAKLLAQRLRAGALPVPIKLVSQQTVGATLGQDSINKSLYAGLIGLILVCFYMIIFYRFNGFLAGIALLVYGAIVLFFFKVIPVTLTLSGIAGFILSIGMAVDANVLIFARLKEEIAAGRSIGAAIDEAFKRAWPSIRDGNFTTLISCLALFLFSSSTIKGFALTLGIGVIISIFSAIVITKLLLKAVSKTKLINVKWLFYELNNKSKE